MLASEATNHELIAALRAHIFACFSAPYDTNEVVAMAARAIEETDWKGGIEVFVSAARLDRIEGRVSQTRMS